VPPGKEGKIELAVEHTAGFSGEVAKSASVSTNDPKTRVFNLTLRARFKSESGPSAAPPTTASNAKNVLTVEPGDRWITSTLAGSSAANSFFLYNPRPTPVHVKQIVAGGQNFTATLQTIEDGKRYQLSVASNPALKPGHYVQTLKAVTDSAEQPEVSIELDVTVYPKVFVSPTSILMPPLPITADVSTITWPSIYLRKVRDQGLKIKRFTSTLPFLKLDLVNQTEGQVYQIRITLDTTKIKPGDFKGNVHIETNDPDVPVVDVPVQVTFKK
jgi:hypothetical protein